MGKYDKHKQTHRNEDYETTRKIKVQNILCDVASEIAELREVIERFSEKFEKPESLIDKLLNGRRF